MTFYDNYYGEYDEEILPGVKISRASDKPCIVCGNKTGNCTSKNYEGPDHIVTLGKDEELAKTDMVTVKEDIYEERLVAKGTMSRFLVARKGRQITKEKAAELGII